MKEKHYSSSSTQLLGLLCLGRPPANHTVVLPPPKQCSEVCPTQSGIHSNTGHSKRKRLQKHKEEHQVYGLHAIPTAYLEEKVNDTHPVRESSSNML